MKLDGVSAIVTGGASGLGEATVRALAEAGAVVCVADLQEDRGADLAGQVGGVFVRTDVTSPFDVRAAVETAADAGPLRAVVNCAGIGIAMRTIGRDGSYDSAHDLESYRRILEIDLVGTFDVIRTAATVMSRLEPDEGGCRGAIVNTGSVAARDGQIGQVAYASAKAGVVGLTLPVARDLGPSGIRINTILPGFFDTPAYGAGEQAAMLQERFAKDVVFPRRFGRPAEFASLALELLRNDYMNGETIRIDGGVRMPPKSG